VIELATGLGPEVVPYRGSNTGWPGRALPRIDRAGYGVQLSFKALIRRANRASTTPCGVTMHVLSREPSVALLALRARFASESCRCGGSLAFALATHRDLGRLTAGSADSSVCTFARCPGRLPGSSWTSPAQRRDGNLR
jgi:hypothetical protein